MIVHTGLVFAITICAVMSIRSARLLHATLWLTGVGVGTTIMLYLVGAYTIAVIELSLSVGLITVLLVFAISMVGADAPDMPVAKWFNWPLLAAMLLLTLGLTLPYLNSQSDTAEASFSIIFWELREADVFAQVALIFAGVLGVLGLLAEIGIGQNRQILHTAHTPPGDVVAKEKQELETE